MNRAAVSREAVKAVFDMIWFKGCDMILKTFDLMRELLFELLEDQQRLFKEYGKRKR